MSRSALTSSGSTTRWRKIRQRVLVRDCYTCQYCSQEADSVDHVIPRSLGGGDEDWNLVASCMKCNLARRSPKSPNRAFFNTGKTPPTPHGLFSPQNGSQPTESVSHDKD
jgi:5-methylcytosine-specific restriction endonuclease McrA